MKDPSRIHRSLAKGITWETFSFFLTLFITYLYTQSIKTSFELTSICFFIKIIFFFLHERLWHQVTWGKHSTERNQNV
jgi:uncharacterized membrane protein